MTEPEKYTQDEIADELKSLPKVEKITPSWFKNDPKSRLIVVTYPEHVASWDEYYDMIDTVRELSETDTFAAVHLPLKARMPSGSPFPPIKKALMQGEHDGMRLVVMCIQDNFVFYIINKLMIPTLNFNSGSKRVSVETIEAAAKELASF